jgi:hypothetical protein
VLRQAVVNLSEVLDAVLKHLSYIGAMPTNENPADALARAIVHPSQMLPGIPQFMFSVPLGWVLDEAPGALAVVRLPEQVDGFWVNAILSHDKVARSVDYKQAAQATWAKIQRSAKDVTEQGEKLVRFGNLVMYIRGAEMTSASGTRVAQVHAQFFAPVSEGGKVVDFFQFNLSAPTSAASNLAKSFTEMLSTFRFL